MNLVGADLERDDGSLFARFGEHRLRIDDEVLAARPDLNRFDGKPLILGIRPEDLEDASIAGEAPPDQRMSANVDIREDMGSEVYIHFGAGGRPVRGKDVAAAIGDEAIEATEQQTKGKGSLFVARVGRESKAREDERMELVVATSHLHFFDPETGRGIYDGAEGAG
jgi:multiple sugar transport system ATP-binding protein